MSENSRSEARELRKRVVRLEAETARLELIGTLNEMRRPRRAMQLDLHSMFTAMAEGKGGWITAATALLGGQRLQWILKAIPLALAGWRVAKLLQGYVAKHRTKVAE